jgi:hypothetical protein
MQFPFKFSRWVGTSLAPEQIELGSDTDPGTTDPAGLSSSGPLTNLFSHRIRDTTGWPCHRIAGVVRYIGSGTAPSTLPIILWLWESSTGAWHKLFSGTIAVGSVNFYDTIGPVDLSSSSGGASALGHVAGSETIYIQADHNTPTTPDGEYVFAFCADLTTGIL